MEEEKKETNVLDKTTEQVENAIKKINETGVQIGNIDYLSKLIDIHKDIEEEKCKKEEKDMRYNDYGDYGTERYGESYGRRGVPGTGRRYYRAEAPLEEMRYHYGNYHESNNYGAKEDSAFKMTEALKDFIYTFSQELEPNEKTMLKKSMQEIMQNIDR